MDASNELRLSLVSPQQIWTNTGNIYLCIKYSKSGFEIYKRALPSFEAMMDTQGQFFKILWFASRVQEA